MIWKLIPASESKVRRCLRWFVKDSMWCTYRLPFQKYVRITYPDRIVQPDKAIALQHELYHVTWFSTWWGPWIIPILVTILPLPVFFSGRWFVERNAYLNDVLTGIFSVDDTVTFLWKMYCKPWPKVWMRKWFLKQISKTMMPK